MAPVCDESPMVLRYAWSGKLVTSLSADKDGASSADGGRACVRQGRTQSQSECV